jgi:MFS superfamily sulfate permease-like transporter
MNIESSAQGSAKQIGWMRWLPGIVSLRAYRIAWLPHDIAAGIVLTTVLVPVGIAYAIASGLPGIYGLYATIVPLLAYALFGPSRILWFSVRTLRSPRSYSGSCFRSRVAIRAVRSPWPP